MLIESLSVVWIAGFDGFLKRWSPRLGAILGYSRDELMVMPLQSLIHPDDLAAADTVGRLCRGEGVDGVEIRLRARDGEYKWILWNAVPCLSEGVYLAMGHDLTARKDVERQLRESEDRFQLIASATDEALWDWDLKSKRFWHNEAYREAYGSPNDKAEDPGEWWCARVHPDDQPRVVNVKPSPVANGGRHWAAEYRRLRADGTYAQVYQRALAMFDERGEVVRVVGSIIDITALKRTEQRLRESEERFRLAAKATRDAIWDWDLRTDAVWRSEGFQTLFGYAAEDVVSDVQWWADRIHPDDRERHFTANRADRQGGVASERNGIPLPPRRRHVCRRHRSRFRDLRLRQSTGAGVGVRDGYVGAAPG